MVVTWAVSLFRDAYDRNPKPTNWSLWAIYYALTTPRVEQDKLSSPAWSPARYEEGATRSRAAVRTISCLVFDFDDGQDPCAAYAHFQGYQALAHTSWSHTPERPKFRLILPLAAPIPGSLWSRVWKRLQCAGADSACSDPSRLFFLPSIRHESWPFESWTFDGQLLDLTEVAEEVAREKPPPWKRAQARATLSSRQLKGAQRRVLQTDPNARRKVGERIGGTHVAPGLPEEAYRHIPCPQCGRADVYFFVDPERMTRAYCNHRKSCGFSSRLEELI